MDNLRGKRLLVLGGSRISCEIVRRAQEFGIYVLVTDWYPVEKSPAKQIADEALLVSTADVDAVVQLIKDKNIHGVITGFTDSVLPYYAKICEKAGLPCYGTVEQFEIMINKRIYKELCVEFGVPTVEEYSIDGTFKDEVMEKIKFPVLVKPADNSGARGVSICENKGQLIEAYMDIQDAAAGIIALLATDRSKWKKVYNFGSQYRYTIKEIAEAVARVSKDYTKNLVKIEIEEKDIELDTGMDSTLFYGDTGWTPKHDLEAMIRNIFSDYA